MTTPTQALESVQGQQELQMKLAEGERQLASAQEALVCKQDAWDKELQLHKRCCLTHMYRSSFHQNFEETKGYSPGVFFSGSQKM